MYDGYLSIGGYEVLNRARTAAYIKSLLPGKADVLCDDAALRPALGHGAYTTPARDNAPWYRGRRQAGAKFLGLLPGKVQGAEDSTLGVDQTELSGDGAIFTSPRYSAKEMRFTATAFALDEEGMSEGWAWLRDTLSNDGCSEAEFGCTGREMKMFAAMPATKVAAYGLSRNFHRVEVTEGPLLKKQRRINGFLMWELEFTVTAGIPWAFTSLADIGTLAMDTGVNHQDAVGENCGAGVNAYDDFVTDPYYTAISRPPRPPVILPPNVLDISSWRRKTLTIPATHTQRWGRVAPVVNVLTENAVQYMRIRFYRESAGTTGCDYDGEFLISYIPATAILTLDAIRREATMKLSDGRRVPAGHLLFGSDGKPFMWPTLGCQHNYTMVADLMPGQPGVAVVLETAVRE